MASCFSPERFIRFVFFRPEIFPVFFQAQADYLSGFELGPFQFIDLF